MIAKLKSCMIVTKEGKMKFEIKDNKWKRYNLFWYYINNLRNVLSMTCNVDITGFLNYVKKNKYRFYPSFMWVVSKIINSHEEFKLGWNDNNQPGLYDIVHPYFAHFYKEDEQCALLYVEYKESLEEFHKNFVMVLEQYKDCRAFDFKDVPRNVFNASCLPWVNYNSFDIHVFDEGKYLAPVVTWGKYKKNDEKIIMPLSFNIHHAAADGFHLSRFFTELQEYLDSFEK